MTYLIRSYPKVYALGHRAIADLLLDPVVIEEKIDGSQFSFGIIDGVLQCRSHKCQLDLDSDNGMFNAAVQTAQALSHLLVEGRTYRTEFLAKPKHNTLAYDRAPTRALILYDVDRGMEDFMDRGDKENEARMLGLEVVPILHFGKLKNMDMLVGMLDIESCLGGVKIEGVVIKNYDRFARDGHALMGKYVSEAYNEAHKVSHNLMNPSGPSIKTIIAASLNTTARFEKAVQHLRDQGLLENEPRDIGALMRELHRDIEEECSDEIKDALYKWARKDILRGAVRGFPEWYKKRFAESQFQIDDGKITTLKQEGGTIIIKNET